MIDSEDFVSTLIIMVKIASTILMISAALQAPVVQCIKLPPSVPKDGSDNICPSEGKLQAAVDDSGQNQRAINPENNSNYHESSKHPRYYHSISSGQSVMWTRKLEAVLLS